MIGSRAGHLKRLPAKSSQRRTCHLWQGKGDRLAALLDQGLQPACQWEETSMQQEIKPAVLIAASTGHGHVRTVPELEQWYRVAARARRGSAPRSFDQTSS